ncbi:MAG: replicative DNA helicase [Actinomycetales bacterium]|nr:replicative DNA helicase [Actinomycetales bacterium]
MSVAEIPRGYPDNQALTPPQDLVAEQSVLGAMLLSKDAIADVIEHLHENDFYKPAHTTIYAAILDIYGRGEPADAITVSNYLTKAGTINNVGGASYLHTLVAGVPTAANASYYARIVTERAVLRRLVEVGTRITQMGYSGDNEIDVLVDRAQAEVFDVTKQRQSEDYQPLSVIVPKTLEEIEAIEGHGGQLLGVPTGFSGLDEITHGLHGGQLVIIAARPGMGKSTLALDLARSASVKNDLTSAIFSLEMSRNEIAMRLLSAEATVNLNAMRGGNLTSADWDRVARRMGAISQAPLFIDDSPNMTMMEIRAKARRLKQRHDLKLIIIDYIQLMSSGRRVESRQVEVSEFSRSLKLLAKELDVPVVALSQLNRGPEQRQDKKPMLSDLRESGSLEQDADMVILLHREGFYEPESQRRGESDFILAKHRNGPTGTITVAWQGHYSRFSEMAATVEV